MTLWNHYKYVNKYKMGIDTYVELFWMHFWCFILPPGLWALVDINSQSFFAAVLIPILAGTLTFMAALRTVVMVDYLYDRLMNERKFKQIEIDYD